MDINRRNAILDQTRMRLSINPPTDLRQFLAEVRGQLVAEAGMSWEASYYAVMRLVRGPRATE
jgi:hypothetical protein